METLSALWQGFNRKEKISFFLIIAMLIYLFIYDPSAKNNLYPPCLIHHFTGYYCSGCGITRATHELLHLHFLQAMRFNILIVILAPALLYNAYQFLKSKYTGKTQTKSVVFKIWFVVPLILISILFMILRNLSAYPFCLLAPHQ